MIVVEQISKKRFFKLKNNFKVISNKRLFTQNDDGLGDISKNDFSIKIYISKCTLKTFYFQSAFKLLTIVIEKTKWCWFENYIYDDQYG